MEYRKLYQKATSPAYNTQLIKQTLKKINKDFDAKYAANANADTEDAATIVAMKKKKKMMMMKKMMMTTTQISWATLPSIIPPALMSMIMVICTMMNTNTTMMMTIPHQTLETNMITHIRADNDTPAQLFTMAKRTTTSYVSKTFLSSSSLKQR